MRFLPYYLRVSSDLPQDPRVPMCPRMCRPSAGRFEKISLPQDRFVEVNVFLEAFSALLPFPGGAGFMHGQIKHQDEPWNTSQSIPKSFVDASFRI